MGIFSLGTVETLIGVEFGLHDRFCSTNFNVYAEFEQGRSEFEGVRTRMHTLSKRREGELILMILTSRPFDLKFHLKKKRRE